MNPDDTIDGARDAALSEAYLRGRRAGLAGLSPSLTPGPPGSAEEQQWLQGWLSGAAELASAYADAQVKREQLREGWRDRPDFDMTATLRGRAGRLP